MALPARIPKQRNRSLRWRSPAHCDFVRSHHCCVPGCQNMPIEVAHVRAGSDAGMGRKPSDWFTVSLCGGPDGHHAEQHRIGEASFQELHKINLHALAGEFAKASPKAGDIRREQRERGHG
jgi:hypothetical protein